MWLTHIGLSAILEANKRSLTSCSYFARVGESVDPADLKSAALIMRTGSSPVTGTKYLAGVMAARWSPKPLVGVRVPGGMPIILRNVTCVN